MIDFKSLGSGIKDAFTGVGDGVSEIIDSAKGQVPPEIELELKKLQTELATKGMELEIETKKALYETMIQYEGSAEQVPKAILILRSLIRPVITIAFFFSFLYFTFSDILNAGKEEYVSWLNSLPDQYWWMFGIVLGFWFGSKSIENAIDKLTQRSVNQS